MNLPDIRAKYLTDHRRLHISLGNLKLPREKHITEAEKLLLSLKPELNNIIGFLGLNVEFKGIGTYPENEPEKAKYVYVKVDYDSNENLGKKFKDATDLIRERFYQAGLSLDCDLIFNEYVIIIKHQSENYHGHDLAQDGKYYSTFNALPILERFSDIKLGNFKIPLIQVCIRDTFRANGRYGSIAELNLS
ncbi:hypothetical protein K502DRAFT_324382 [Neoconidiobolus thromboides FSU 785]|nr:hypothetical protein K502DRAFT_324382 [Neoconidiobolus thromboides FSU 785]